MDVTSCNISITAPIFITILPAFIFATLFVDSKMGKINYGHTIDKFSEQVEDMQQFAVQAVNGILMGIRYHRDMHPPADVMMLVGMRPGFCA